MDLEGLVGTPPAVLDGVTASVQACMPVQLSIPTRQTVIWMGKNSPGENTTKETPKRVFIMVDIVVSTSVEKKSCQYCPIIGCLKVTLQAVPEGSSRIFSGLV